MKTFLFILHFMGVWMTILAIMNVMDGNYFLAFCCFLVAIMYLCDIDRQKRKLKTKK